MTRRKGYRKIDSVHHKLSGKTIDLYYCPEISQGRYSTRTEVGPRFMGEWDGNEHIEVDISVLKADALKYLEETSGLEWWDVIQIELASQFANESVYFGFDLRRYYISKSRVGTHFLHADRREITPDGTNWDTEEYRRRDATPWYDWPKERTFKPPCRADRRGGALYLPFTAEAWAALTGMQEEIERARARFEKFIVSAEGAAKLEVMGREILRMLPAPDGSEAT
jgi:hypothetical protein